MVEIYRHGRQPLIQVSGELDVASAPLLLAMIDYVRHPAGSPDGHGSDRMEVDLARVTFADSHGLAPILDGNATVRAASPAVRRVLQVLQHEPPAAARELAQPTGPADPTPDRAVRPAGRSRSAS